MSIIEVNAKSVQVENENLLVDLIKLGDEEGMLLTEAARIFEVQETAIWQHLKRHNLESSQIVRTKLKELRNLGVIGQRINRATFLPKETIRALAKVIHSDSAWAIYNQLWAVAEKAYEFHTRPTNNIEVLRGMLDEISSQNQRLSNVEHRVEVETPRLVESRIEQALTDHQTFPDDCIRVGEILTDYFPGVARAKVMTYLNALGHPRGSHVHIDDNGLRTVSHPWKESGLGAAADKLFSERKVLKETAKTIIWHHPLAGTMREYKY
ncbi:hypothetical protein [Pseudobacteriovorax antillogorgiicola]|uniref:Uncharacterized protein n=1 Tax=Pseudobacteriovorax antillogorgiicola TaxID=1513793 RepID=A0A1Y6CQ30_9BACT|nr:hypothetical protein [Pseudobacteriovorax antillogorgiicola]TCS44226.1 hypothetical protein EDD56_13426 [Pseudobacteriovorax antillogorgiicola]SMF80604.1 hypothetical protein SAMN06296036_13527 [Pseudobacteriovorax antillogorgiicola]